MSSMNRRSFITQTSVGAGAALGLSALPSLAAPQKDPWQCVRSTVEAAGIPHIYTAGNHDWRYKYGYHR